MSNRLAGPPEALSRAWSWGYTCEIGAEMSHLLASELQESPETTVIVLQSAQACSQRVTLRGPQFR